MMPIELQRKALSDLAFDGPEIDDFLNDPRLYALA